MNCQRFESVVSELARGRMMAVEQRDEALAHTNTCDRCAARLRDEEMLTRGLQSLAAKMEPLAAPANVESKLLEAFRTRHVTTPLPLRHSNSRYWLVAVAAMLLMAISVMVFRWNAGRTDEPRQAVNQEQPQPKPEVREVPNVNSKPSEQFAVNVSEQNERIPVRPKSPRRIHPAALRQPANVPVANRVNSEIATDFIPLRYMSPASLQDGGQIVRVELPRSALANFGVPVNMDRYNERVKADVLVGVDGLAHAIRFVQ